MFHKILVAVDRSEFGKSVFATALDIAKTNHADLTLLHVIAVDKPEDLSLPVSTRQEYFQASDNRTLEICQEVWMTSEVQGREMLRAFAAQAGATGVKAETMQCGGSPGKKICSLAREWGADLIVVGRRGLVGISELLSGSVSNYVLHHAPCSVLTVQL